VEKFIDTPVKRYSSGMMVRLAFAVAAHLEPEILILDEVLAVGDSAFQQKCLDRMNTVAREGRTVLFVSHQAAAVENLCRRGIVLESGVLRFDGTQTEAISYYVNSYTQSTGCLRARTDRKGDGEIRVQTIEMRDTQGKVVTLTQTGQDIDIYLYFETATPNIPLPNLYVTLQVRSDLDVPIFMQSNLFTGDSWGTELPERGAFICRLRNLPLPSGSFRVDYTVFSTHKGDIVHDRLEHAMHLRVEGGDFYGTGQNPNIHQGMVMVPGQWRMEMNTPAPQLEPVGLLQS